MPANRAAKRQCTLPQMMGHGLNPMMMNPMSMAGGMAPIMMGGCNGMMGGMNGMMGGGVHGMMGGMVHPAAMHRDTLAGEVEDEEDDVAAGEVQDAPSSSVAAPVEPALVEHMPPPVIILNDDAAITRSASMIRGQLRDMYFHLILI